MEINLERINNRFDGKLTYGEITEIGNQYKKIHSIIPFEIGLEETIIKHFKCILNKKICDESIGKLQTEKRGYDNELRLLGRGGFDTLRQNRKLDRFRKNRDNMSKNYNQLNNEGNISRVIM